MKRFCILLLVAIALVACEKENESVVRNTDLQEVVAQNKVSLKEALLYAENSINGINPTTRSAERKVKSTEIYVAKPATRSAESTEVSFYLINYENNEGFAMVSTDSRTTPVYAYADKGNITANDLETIPFYNIFMDGAVPYYEYEVANYEGPGPIEIADTLDDGRIIMVDDDVPCYVNTDTLELYKNDAFTTTRWHQRFPYNSALANPNWPASCTPVAAAQIMAYHEWPELFGGYTFNYTLMKSEEVSTSNTPAAQQAARLISLFGLEAETEYNPHNGTSPLKAREALVNFGYNCSELADYNENAIKADIEASRPVLVTGYTGPNENDEGHTWVIDGYRHTYKKIKYYHAEFPHTLYKYTTEGMYTHFRCNIGWRYPDYYVYCLSTDFTFESGVNYSTDKFMVYNIEPNN